MYTTIYNLDSSTLWKAYVLGPGGGRDILFLAAIYLGCAVYGMVRRRFIYLLGVVPLLLFASVVAAPLLREFRWGQRLLDRYARGECQVTEGATHVQAQQRLEGHSIDKIVIGGVPLEISHFELGPQYRDSIVYGGVLKEGVEARVWYCPPSPFGSNGSGPVVRVDVRHVAARVQ